MSSAQKSIQRHPGAAFLLSQIGAHAAELFAEKLKLLKLTPAEAGILRILAGTNGVSQQGLAQMLGMYASRLVAVIDAMERSKLVERRVGASDRRIFEIHLTAKGKERLAAVSKIAREHQEVLCRSLTPLEQETLTELLERIAEDRKLAPGVHPGYRRIAKRDRKC
jgi:DNA-binding MarR family transcriptional regulator